MRRVILAIALASGLAGCYGTVGTGYAYGGTAYAASDVWVDGYWYPGTAGAWAWQPGFYVHPRVGYAFHQGYWRGGFYQAPYWSDRYGHVERFDHRIYGHPYVESRNYGHAPHGYGPHHHR